MVVEFDSLQKISSYLVRIFVKIWLWKKKVVLSTSSYWTKNPYYLWDERNLTILLFLNYMWYEKGRCHKINDPTHMAVQLIFLEIWFFKSWAQTFLPQRNSPTTPKIFYLLIFSNLMSSDRDECESNDGKLLMIRLLLVLEIFEIFQVLYLFPPELSSIWIMKKLEPSIFFNLYAIWKRKRLQNQEFKNHECIMIISWDMVIQHLGQNFFEPKSPENSLKIVLIFEFHKIDVIR